LEKNTPEKNNPRTKGEWNLPLNPIWPIRVLGRKKGKFLQREKLNENPTFKKKRRPKLNEKWEKKI